MADVSKQDWSGMCDMIGHGALVKATPGLIASDEIRLRALLSAAFDRAIGDVMAECAPRSTPPLPRSRDQS